MAITIFYQEYSPRAQEEFREWMTAHPDAFYLNQRGPRDYMIHKGSCPHLFHETQLRLTASKKVCAPDASELRGFAKEEGATINPCSTCGAHA
ncbi:MAG TPA: hypothetical protein VF092_11640 [Longimicrobium sp.]